MPRKHIESGLCTGRTSPEKALVDPPTKTAADMLTYSRALPSLSASLVETRVKQSLLCVCLFMFICMSSSSATSSHHHPLSTRPVPPLSMFPPSCKRLGHWQRSLSASSTSLKSPPAPPCGLKPGHSFRDRSFANPSCSGNHANPPAA